MNNLFRLSAIACLVWIMTGCASMPKGLPPIKGITTEVDGAHLEMKPHGSRMISGELIAVKDSVIYLLTEQGSMLKIDYKDVFRYSVYFGSPDKRYGWTYALFTTLAVSHGMWMFISIPVNMIAAGSVTSSAWMEVTYTNKELPLEQLHIAARFPQGIPETISLSDIK